MSEPSVAEMVAWLRGADRGVMWAVVADALERLEQSLGSTRDALQEACLRLAQIEASASFESDELRGWLVMFSGALAVGDMQGPRPDEARKLDIIRANLERLQQIEAEHQGCQENMESLARERDEYKRDRDETLEYRDRALRQFYERVATLERERDEVKAAFLACAKAAGIVHEAHGVETAPGPLDQVVAAIEDHADRAERVDSLEAEIQEAIAERDAFAAAWDELRAWADVEEYPHEVSNVVLVKKIDELDPRAKGASPAP